MRDEEAARRFVERLSRILTDWGMPPMAARVLVTLTVAEEDALSAPDLCERLEVSPAAISGAVRYLIQLGMVARDPVPGSRRDVYRLLHDSWWEVAMTKVGLYKTLAGMVDEGIEAFGGPDTHAGQTMTELRDFYLFMHEEIPLLYDKWRATR
ncbi:helix-turn-helix domain-containing protein [Spongiactinospora sp. TRM90649]|uniref:GbsR/MarR family transcriptional regulator n=1 Tax=Spongiactinospora sp. TRM90649 TaxID=3031114 RepID=UPI0023F814F1|nr:helix-turn-helix domain-containing protein [Spongiactinospora sp. TRM90649]MDF5754243.1 helix-turn-helix domain-containing protein [Spongiactinospora sp. TRM90649]